MLADRLIQDQVRCAQQEEQLCILRQKVAAGSKQSSEDSSPQVPCSAPLVKFLLNHRLLSVPDIRVELFTGKWNTAAGQDPG